jgi:hypothetical protein
VNSGDPWFLQLRIREIMSTLTRIERSILDILSDFPGYEVSGQDLRTLVQNRGFRRTAPAFIFTMMNLVEKGLVACREEVRMTDMAEVRDRFYKIGQES